MISLSKIRERKLVQWALAYLAGAWLMLQVLDLLVDNFGWQTTTFRLVAALLAVGFLAALVLAWFHGERGHQRVGAVEIAMLAGILLMAGAAVYIVRRSAAAGEETPAAGVAAAPVDPKSIAVLPFQSISADPENAYFASGIHDELLTRLAKLGDLKVISRTSVLAYEGSKKTVREIAAELGVATVLEGSIQRVGNKVRMQAQLIDAATDDHIWSETYDRDLTDIFAIQSDLAQQIAGALQATLSAGDRKALAGSLTDNPEAYDAYMRALELDRSRAEERMDVYTAAIRLYERAVELDPRFALAYARMSRLHGWISWLNMDPTEARRQKQLAAARRAVELDPDLPEARMAMGYYHYFARRDYDAALREFETSLRGAPNNSELIFAVGAIHRRQGKVDENIRLWQRAIELDPYNPNLYQQLGDSYRYMRRYADAVRMYDRALALHPGDAPSAAAKAETFIDWRGDVGPLRALASQMRADDAPPLFQLSMLTRDFPGALRAAESAPHTIQGYRRFVARDLLRARALAALGNAAAARTASARALAVADSMLRQDDRDPRYHVFRGFALAGLGRREDARAAARRAMELMPPTRDFLVAAFIAEEAAAVLAQTGDAEGALPLIKRLLDQPSMLSVYDLRLDPVWDPIRHDPRFAELGAASR